MSSPALSPPLGQLAALEHLLLFSNQQLTGQEVLRGFMEEPKSRG